VGMPVQPKGRRRDKEIPSYNVVAQGLEKLIFTLAPGVVNKVSTL